MERYLEGQLVCALIGFPEKMTREFSKHFDNVAAFKEQGTTQTNQSALVSVYFEERVKGDVLGIQFKK